MQLIDTHAHVCFDAYDPDRDQMMSRAFENGVKKMVHPCCNLPESQELLDFATKYNGTNQTNVFCSIGVHPTEFHTWNECSEEFIEQFLQTNFINNPKSKIKAIGEAGLDFYHCTNEEEHQIQKDIFEKQILIAKKYKLPLIVHTRDAWDATLEILRKHFQDSGIINPGTIHCFTGDLSFAQECIKLGFFISWGGVLTYKKNEHFRQMASKLDINKILLETDSPYLSPQAFRGKRNEPAFVTCVAEELAKCYGVSTEEIASISTQNAERLFGI